MLKLIPLLVTSSCSGVLRIINGKNFYGCHIFSTPLKENRDLVGRLVGTPHDGNFIFSFESSFRKKKIVF